MKTMQKTKPNIMKIFLFNDREVSRRSSGELPGEELPVRTVAQREFLNRENYEENGPTMWKNHFPCKQVQQTTATTRTREGGR